jgi:dipeptidyl aminopeptidase/acylaminoacyl peptidase
MMSRNRMTSVSLCVVMLLLASPARAGAQETTDDRWTPELSMRYFGVGGTTISPDGRYIAYTIRKPLMEGEKSEYLSHIWIVTTDGERNLQYTQGDKSAGSPSFSPDSRYLAFTSSRSGKNQIWIMPVMGGEAQQITDVDPGVGGYRWSPDGNHFAYTMRDPETAEEKKAKEEKRDVILVDQNFKYNHLYTVEVEQGESGERVTKRLTAGDFHIRGFDWSPDSRTIVFSYKDDPRINTNRLSGDIAAVPADSGAVSQLVVSAGINGNPRYSPDGRWVAFESTGNQLEPIGLADLYVVSAGGGTPRKLAETHDRFPINIVGWTGDSRNLLVGEIFGTTTGLQSLPVDGGALSVIIEGDGVARFVSLNGDASMMAFTWQNTDTPADVYVSPVDHFSKRKLTDVHAHVPRPTMGRTELLSWKSQDGEYTIEGLLTYPVDYQPGRRYPLVLNVHGGPAGVFIQLFTGRPNRYMIQQFAQEGVAILRPNPRGSTGYGKEFRYANFRDWGYGDMDDLMAGVDHVIDMGVGHPDSLLLMGWSYGGYMTSFAVTRTNRFKAASMGAGLPNLVSMITTTDIGDYLVAHMGDEFWNDYEEYEKHSAIYRIANVTTPTQVIHGANDLRVPFTQGQEFYRALQRRGVPTEMVVYPRTPHSPREPKFLMDVTTRILTWFNKHMRRSTPTTDH